MNRQRCKNILDELSISNIVSGKDLAEKLGVSTRTIRSDIDDLRALFVASKVEIQSKNNQGYSIKIEDNDFYKKVYDELNNSMFLDCQKDRIRYMLELFTTNNDKYYPFNKLEEKLFVSKSTLYNDLKELSKVIENYNLELVSNTNGYKIVGNEFDIRLCVTNSILETITKSNDNLKEIIKKISHCVETNLLKFNIHINQIAYSNLILHIYVAFQRIEKGHYISSDINFEKEIKDSIEYECAKQIVAELQPIFKIEIPENEIYYVAIHLASKKVIDKTIQGKNLVIKPEIYQMVNEMLEKIDEEYNVDLKHDLDLRMVLATHLVPMTVRLSYDTGLINPLIKEIKNRFPLAYMMACSACSVLSNEYQKKISDDEIGFIALHINLAIERSQIIEKKKNIIIVCATGKGSAELLSFKVKSQFGNAIDKVLLVDVMQLKKIDISNYDYIFTTVKIPFEVGIPILEIQLFLDDQDLENVKKILSEKTNKSNCFSSELFIPTLEVENKNDCIRKMLNYIKKYRNIPNSIYDSILQREEMGYTAIGNSVAMPHAVCKEVSDSFVCFAILEKPIEWNESEVQLVCMFILSENKEEKIDNLVKSLSKVVFDKETIKELVKNRSYETLVRILNIEQND